VLHGAKVFSRKTHERVIEVPNPTLVCYFFQRSWFLIVSSMQEKTFPMTIFVN